MWTVTSFGKGVLLFVDGIPKCGTKTVVDNVSDLVVGVEVFGVKVQEASTNTIEFSISSLVGNLFVCFFAISSLLGYRWDRLRVWSLPTVFLVR